MLALIHSFWPDRYSVLNINNNDDHFEFSIEPWKVDIDFVNIVLKVKDNMFSGAHPLLEPSKEYHCEKSGN